MTNNIYKKVERFIVDTFTKAGDDHGIKHFVRTVYWVKVLGSNVDEAMLVSALAHDIERGFQNRINHIANADKGFRSDKYLVYHQNEGARIIGEYLREISADPKFIERVKMLVSKHEVGGNDDQNLLKDADSVSFFENNIDHFVSKKVGETSKDKVKDKFDWMFNRISSEKAKQIVRPWYEEAIKKLGF